MSYELVAKQENNLFQTFRGKMGSLSLTIIFGVPCSFWTVFIKELVIVLTSNGRDSAHKCAYLVILSTTTMMTLFPSEHGKHVIKSIETSVHLWLGMESGCKRPGVLIVSTLFCWQTKHSAKKF